MTAAAWSDVDDHDLLSTIADPHPIVGADVPTLFLDACRTDAEANGGYVSVNRVRALLADADIEPHRFSAMWSHHTGRGKAMVRDGWDECVGSSSRNDGKLYARRRWVDTT